MIRAAVELHIISLKETRHFIFRYLLLYIAKYTKPTPSKSE